MDQSQPSNLPNVYVGGLSFDTTKETLEAHFSNYGRVKSAVVITDPTGKSKGYGFVNYYSVEDRDKALEVSHELQGRHLNCSVAKESNKNRSFGMGTGMGGSMGFMGGGGMGGVGMQRSFMGGAGGGGGGGGGGGMYNSESAGGSSGGGGYHRDDDDKKVFIGGLHEETLPEHIECVLGRFGKIEQTIIKRDKETNRSRGFGFVVFDSVEAASKARKEHYVDIIDKKVEIKSVNPSPSQGAAGYNSYNNGNVYGQGYDNSYQYSGYSQNYSQGGAGGGAAASSSWQTPSNSWPAGGDSSWNSSGYSNPSSAYNATSTTGGNMYGGGMMPSQSGQYSGSQQSGSYTTGADGGSNYW